MNGPRRRASSSAYSAREFSRDPATRAYRIERILPGENWDKHTPFAAHRHRRERQAGRLHSRRSTARRSPPCRTFTTHLIGTADKQVILRVNSEAERRMARVTSPSCRRHDEAPLYYLRLGAEEHRLRCQENRRRSRLPAHSRYGTAGLNEFTKLYFPQIRKESAHRRCARQRRRLCLAAGDRAAPARAGHDRDRAQRHAADPIRRQLSRARWSR